MSSRILVTGSAGHLGDALVRVLRDEGHDVVGFDLLDSPYTDVVGSVVDRECVRRCMSDIEVVLHTATLHKPHIVSHSRQQFVAASGASSAPPMRVPPGFMA